MLTGPQIPSFREEAISRATPLIDFASRRLKSLVDSAEEIFQSCLEVAGSPRREDYPSLTLFRHVIEMSDGVQILLCAGTGGPMIPILRSMFEAFLSLRFIMERDYERRSLAWIYSYCRSEIEQKKRLSGQGEIGRELREIFLAELGWLPDSFQNPDRYAAEVEKLEQEILRPVFETITPKPSESKPAFRPWYTLCGTKLGNRKKERENLKDLANHLSFRCIYERLYGPWSRVLHATDTSPHVVLREDGTTGFSPLRCAEQLRDNVGYSFVMLFDAQYLMLEKFFPGKQLTQSREKLDNIIERLNKFVPIVESQPLD